MKLLITTLLIGLIAALGPTFTQTTPPLVTFPSPQVEFIIGPQVKSGTSDAKGANWFDQNAIDRGLQLCSAFPDVAHTPGNLLISGTVSVTNGTGDCSKPDANGNYPEPCIVRGSGTHFLTDTKDYAIISQPGARRIIKIVSKRLNDTTLILTLPWQGVTASGQTMSSPSADEVDVYQGYQMYYGFALTQYVNYYRTGDIRFRDCARKAADSWYSQPIIDEGKNLYSVTGEGLAPRMAAISGLILRALDGRPEMWPWITDYVGGQFHNWDEAPNGWPATSLYFGVRDGGFMLLEAANLAAVHPDSMVRADFTGRVLTVAKNYYARLQYPDGSYRWNFDDSAPGALDGLTGVEQPFQVGILNEAMIAVHRLTGDATVRSAIIKSADHEMAKSYSTNGWRGLYYYTHGSFNTGVSCEAGCGAASNPFPPADTGQIYEVRQLNATWLHVFGYAYLLTGDPKYKAFGDEAFDATYSGGDGYRGLASFRGKEYDESYRSGGRYLAWRGGSVSTPLPSPTPSPTATPTPSPIATPSPNPTPTPAPKPKEVVVITWPSAKSARATLWQQMGGQGYMCFPYDSVLYCSR